MFSAYAPILRYHQITGNGAPEGPPGCAMPVSQFERQMCYLEKHGYRCLPLVELLQSSGEGLPWRKKTFALTFDDGYEDFLTQAYPILRRYGFTATVFLVTDLVGGQSRWEGESGTSLLTWEQVTDLHDRGISFGSHTCTHRRLPCLPGEQIWHELTTSKACLEAKLGHGIQLLAYPYGESNSEIHRIAVAAGYSAACGVDTGRGGRFNAWRCPCCADENLLAFAFKLSRWYRHSIWFRQETVLGQLLRRIKHRWFSDGGWPAR